MLWLSRLRLRLRSLRQTEDIDAELSGEMAFHLAEQKAEFMASGMSEREADAAARRAFGPVASIAENCRERRQTRWIEDFVLDSKYAFRGLRKSPGFAVVAVLTLALGIGANTAFFSTAYGILFRPLPYPNSERLVDLGDGVFGVGPVTALRGIAHEADYAGYLSGVDLNLQQTGGEASRVRAATATWNLARVLGVGAARGRWFAEAEEQVGTSHVAVLSDRMWRERFGSDPAILGRRLSLNEESYEVVGVMPAGFAFPSPETELWIPIRIAPKLIGEMWGSGNLLPIGRLRTGASFDSARGEIRPAVDRLRAMFPWKMPDLWGASTWPIPYSEALSKSVRPKMLALSAASLLLLLIACGNVGNLLLARSVQREREFAMREALGAGRGRLLRQSMAENLVLVVAGGAGGLFSAIVILEALPLLLPKDTPRLQEIIPGSNLLLMAVVSMLLTVALFSCAPLFRQWRMRRESLMGKAVTASRRMSGLSLALIGVELALATTLLIGAALMGRTLWELSQVDSGVHTPGIVSARISVPPSRCPKADACLALLEQIDQTLLAEPGVRSVNWSNNAPLDRGLAAIATAIEDHPKPPTDPAFMIWQSKVTPGYFKALGIRLVAGRLLTDADRRGTLPVMLISESTAKRFWPHESAIGKRMRPVSDTEWRIVAGVVSDVAQYSLTGFPDWIDGVEYVPLAQFMPRGGVQLSGFIESARSQGILSSITASLRRRFPDVVVSRVASLEQIRSESVTDQRSTAWLLALLAALGLVLGVAGVYGVISHRASQRTREIGIRMAMGASAGRVIRMVLRETLVVSIAGSLAGVAAAYAMSRFLISLLFGITDHDVTAFAVCPIVLLTAAVLAAAFPAARASRTDAAVTLRDE